MSGDELELRLAWERHLGRSDAARRWFEAVVARHRASDRHYHGLRHVAWVVRHVETLAARQLVDDEAAVVAAGFFHDAVYDPTRHDNELASAELAGRALTELGWPDARIRHVAAMIVATASHELEGVDRDTAALLAADLAVLAADPGPYGDYVRNVRREYAHVPDDAWATGRAAVLERLIGRERLFAVHLGLDGWERRARANIAAELAELGRRPDQ